MKDGDRFGKGFVSVPKCLGGGIGRHVSLKMIFPDGSAGSIPAPSTKLVRSSMVRARRLYRHGYGFESHRTNNICPSGGIGSLACLRNKCS